MLRPPRKYGTTGSIVDIGDNGFDKGQKIGKMLKNAAAIEQAGLAKRLTPAERELLATREARRRG